MDRHYISIKPGHNGAMSIFTESGMFVSVHDLSISDNSNCCATELMKLKYFSAKYKVLHAYIEDDKNQPKTIETIRLVLSSSKIPTRLMTPNRWKIRFVLLSKPKDLAREKVIHLLPKYKVLFDDKENLGRAEAVLIGITGMGRNYV